MHSLEMRTEMGIVTLGPWPSKFIFQNHSELHQTRGVYIVPLKSNESAIDSITLLHDGILFQITAPAMTNGINPPRLDTLMKPGVFVNFVTSNPKRMCSSFGPLKPRHMIISQNKISTERGKAYASLR